VAFQVKKWLSRIKSGFFRLKGAFFRLRDLKRKIINFYQIYRFFIENRLFHFFKKAKKVSIGKFSINLPSVYKGIFYKSLKFIKEKKSQNSVCFQLFYNSMDPFLLKNFHLFPNDLKLVTNERVRR
jgi:hypothetical protein